MKINHSFIMTEVSGKTVLVPRGESSRSFSGVITLNETGRRIWEILPDCADADEITEKLLEEFDVDEFQCAHDVNEFLIQLFEAGVIDDEQ